jgi:predicted phosphodiesterase
MKKILSIGDIHGSSAWKENFLTEEGKVILSESSIEKVIFVGDYVDSFSYKDEEIRQNLLDIIDLKKRYPERVILLIGNHDIQYINPSPSSRCSGFRSTMFFDLHDIFKSNKDLFKFAHFESDIEGDKVLWTHAGVTNGWYNQLIGRLTKDNFRFKDEVKSILEREHTVDEILNFVYEINLNDIYFVDYHSGGIEEFASPIWVRPKVLIHDSLKGYDQVVGHTPLLDIDIRLTIGGTLYFIDTQEYGNKSILHFDI